MKKERWFKPTIHTGWDKDMPENERRSKMFMAHKGDALAAGRAMQALANVSTDEETRMKSMADALYFYRQHHEQLRVQNNRMRITSKFRRLPR